MKRVNSLIIPDWSAPPNIHAYSTTRLGGVSQAPWKSLNLADYVGDDAFDVEANRRHLIEIADLPRMPTWIEQVHGTKVLRIDGTPQTSLKVDAAWSNQVNTVCAVMTADCLPVLFCSFDGREVAAAHAGWRGLCAGILEATVENFSVPPEHIHAWLGPAIGPSAFEVGPEVRAAFLAHSPEADSAFRAIGEKYFTDLWQLARQRLLECGVSSIRGGGQCTFSDPERFFSFRREKMTGRMVSLIWRASL